MLIEIGEIKRRQSNENLILQDLTLSRFPTKFASLKIKSFFNSQKYDIFFI